MADDRRPAVAKAMAIEKLHRASKDGGLRTILGKERPPQT
jgi:hypothetical protein